MDTVFKALPTDSGFWVTIFAAVINAIVSSKELFATLILEDERFNASPNPSVVMAKLFE